MTRTELTYYPWRALLIALAVFVIAMLLIEVRAETFECSTRKSQTGARFNYPVECAELEWDPSPGATYYEVWRKMHGAFLGLYSEWEYLSRTDEPVTWTALESHIPDYPLWRRFQVRVKACNDSLPGGVCSELSREKIWVRRLR